MNSSIKRCKRCIIPNSSDFIEFDSDGVCSLCRSAEKLPELRQGKPSDEDELNKQIAELKERGKGRPFDCLVGLSGGRDSVSLLYLLVTKHNLRCLAAYYRTPFTCDVIHDNVRKLVAQLNVPLVEMKLSKQYHKNIARKMVMLWMKKPNPIIANLACAPCKLVNREVYRIASVHKIPTIVFGGNIFELLQMATSQSKKTVVVSSGSALSKRFSLKTRIKKAFSLLIKGMTVLGKSLALWRYIPIGFKASIMYISPHSAFLRLRYPRIRALEYFYYAGWDESKNEDILEKVGWQLPAYCNSTWKADCSFDELKNLMFDKMMGITYMDAYLSNMVRAGVLTREEAIKRIGVEGKPSAQRLEEVCRFLDLPDEVLQRLGIK